MKSVVAVPTFVICLALVLFLPRVSPGAAENNPFLSGKCIKCHTEYRDMKEIIAGDFNSLSKKARSITVDLEGKMQIIKFTPETEVKNVDSVKELKKPIPVRVHYRKEGEDLVAEKIVAKPKIKVPEEQLIDTEELAGLIAQGPEKGRYTLVDSRPGVKFQEGHIPSAVSVPFPKMADLKERLPKAKDGLLIFYCEGLR